MILVLVAALPSAPARAAPDPLQPVGSWVFDTGRERCAAAQSYASGKKRAVLGFKKVPMSSGYGLFLEVPGEIKRKESRPAKLAFGQLSRGRSILAGRSAKANHIFYDFGARPEEVAAMKVAGTLRVEAPGINVLLPLSGLDAALSRLETCTSGLLVKWGLSLRRPGTDCQFSRTRGRGARPS